MCVLLLIMKNKLCKNGDKRRVYIKKHQLCRPCCLRLYRENNTKICKIDGCDRKTRSLNLCEMHYLRQRKGIKDMCPGPLPRAWPEEDPRLRKNKHLECSVINCKNEYYAKSYCRVHYNLNRRHGAPLYKEYFPKPICKVENCHEISIIKGFCQFHYKRSANNVKLDRPKGLKGELNPNWNGGIFTYPNHYEMKKNRLIVLEEANWICHYCGGKADRVHHRDKTKHNHEIRNLIPSCAKCNAQRQDNNNRRYYLKRYGISSVNIMAKLELSKCEVNMMYDNGYLGNVLKLHRLHKRI